MISCLSWLYFWLNDFVRQSLTYGLMVLFCPSSVSDETAVDCPFNSDFPDEN